VIDFDDSGWVIIKVGAYSVESIVGFFVRDEVSVYVVKFCLRDLPVFCNIRFCYKSFVVIGVDFSYLCGVCCYLLLCAFNLPSPDASLVISILD